MTKILFLKTWTHDTYHRRVRYPGGKVLEVADDVAEAALEAGAAVTVNEITPDALGEPEPSLDHLAPETGDGTSTLEVD